MRWGSRGRHGTDMVGQTISHYRVVHGPYVGGMGEVYEAEDLKLGRRVALKFLKEAHRRSAVDLQRFEREARTLSALNNPHICTIYELGEHEGQPFIVMELLDGESLTHALRAAPFKLDRLINLSSQIADGLSAAHQAGVVHRDIKPGNIFITAHGDVKLLDFGLAKLGPAIAPKSEQPDASTRTDDDEQLTRPGQVVGTVPYMSPEQTQGEPVDHRTDLFSFGSVIYEMATGQRPFKGATPYLEANAIRDAAPVPAGRLNRELPAELDAFLSKALEKNPALRYQYAADMRLDLQRLRHHLLDKVMPPRRRPWWMWLGAATVAAAVLVGGYWWLERDALPSFEPRPVTTGPGVESEPSLSPDGTSIAYTSTQDGNTDIWIVDVQGGPPRRFTSGPASETHPSWFPDGRSLLFTKNVDGRLSIWSAPRFSGESAGPLIDDAQGAAVSNDGKTIVFSRKGPENYYRVAVAPLADLEHTSILTGPSDGLWDHRNPAWSPDGRTICYQTGDGLWLVRLEGERRPRRLTDSPSDAEPVWSPDGQFIYFTSYRDKRYSLWRIRPSETTARRVTVGSGVERSPSISRDGRIVAFSTFDEESRHLSLLDLETGREKPVTDSTRADYFPSFSPDGNTVYFVSNRWEPSPVWSRSLADPDVNSALRGLTTQAGTASFLECSPDGKWLAYYLIAGGRRDIYVLPAAGGSPSRITDGRTPSFQPSWSPDSSTLAYAADSGKTQQIWTQAVSNGHAVGSSVRLTSSPGGKKWPVWLDQRRVAYVTEFTSAAGVRTDDLAVASLDGREPRRLTTGADVMRVRWSRALGVFLVSGKWGGSEVLLRAFDADFRPVGRFGPGFLLGTNMYSGFFDVRADGRFAVFSRARDPVGDIWVLVAEKGRF
jgi:serine/threonine protein kinase